jgi:four helix bundle protein
MYPFEKLLVWQKAHALAVAILGDVAPGADARLRIVADQAWRAACSIGANIAEGAGSASPAQFARYLGVAQASAYELENHLRVARDARLLDARLVDRRIASIIEVKRMLWSLRETVKRNSKKKEPTEKENGG